MISKANNRLFIGNLSHPSINRWGGAMLWLTLYPSTIRNNVPTARSFVLQSITSTFVRSGLTYGQNILTREFFAWNSISKEIEPEDELWYQRIYYRRTVFRTSYVEGGVHYFARKNKTLVYLGEIALIEFQLWSFIIVGALRTFKKKKKNVSELKNKKMYQR